MGGVKRNNNSIEKNGGNVLKSTTKVGKSVEKVLKSDTNVGKSIRKVGETREKVGESIENVGETTTKVGESIRKVGKTRKKVSKSQKTMDVIAWRAGYYRENPQRFVKDFLNIRLRLFQKILIYAMMKYDYFFFVASRGLGKTYLVALFACIRCILYPGTKIVAMAPTFKQGKEIILKITDDFMHSSKLLRNEILRTSTGLNDCGVWFKNGSWIQVRVANDNSRGARSNILIIDEVRMVKRYVISTVARPMNSSPRQPGYLSKKEYSHLKEMNKEFYMTSAWYKQSEVFDMVKAYFSRNLDNNAKYFLCDLPYMIAIQEELLMREQVLNEMSEETFSDISFAMEREGIFYGSSEDSLFNYNNLIERRTRTEAFYPLSVYDINGISIPSKEVGEKRILSVDVALLASKKHDNDASAIIINQALPTTNDSYKCNIVYIETIEDILSQDLALIIMRYFYKYKCDYLVLDCTGVGQPILDEIMQDRYDSSYGETYKAMTCINNDELAVRCKDPTANKCVYAIKANAKLNNDLCVSLRSAILNGYVNFLVDETDVTNKETWNKVVKNYNKLSDNDQTKVKLPFYQTSALINEMINLDYDLSNGLIKVREKSGARKDRFSSLEYSYYVIEQLKLKKRKRKEDLDDLLDTLTIHKGYSASEYYNRKRGIW